MVQTRSTAKAARDRVYVQLPHAGASVDRYTMLAEQPRRKRRKDEPQIQEPVKKESMRGRLALLPQVNLDVLLLIFSYLCPRDLLNLARSTRLFRQFLMSRSHAVVWVRARKQPEFDGLPECPPDMSEPQYANLAFDPHCHNCGRVVRIIYWNIRRRYCSGCRETQLLAVRGCKELPDILRILPSEFLQGAQKIRDGGLFVDKEQYDVVYKTWREIPVHERDAFIAERHEILAQRAKQARKCRHWHSTMVSAGEQSLSEKRRVLQESIFAHLVSAGHAREIQYFGEDRIREYHDYDFFHIPDSEYPTKKRLKEVYSNLKPRMRGLRNERLLQQVFDPRRKLLIKVYNQYIQDPAPEGGAVDLLPAVWDVGGFEPFSAIIHLPEGEVVEEKMFIPLLDQLPPLARQWREKVDAQLASIVATGLEHLCQMSTCKQQQTDMSPKERLQLACAVFGFRDSAFEAYLSTGRRILAEAPVFYNTYDDSLIKSAHPWELPQYGRILQLFSGATDVVVACGLDPQIATVDDMDQSNARLTCNECRERSAARVEVFDWKLAMHHAYTRYHATKSGPKQWELLDENLVSTVKAAEQLYAPLKSPAVVFCALCQQRAQPTYYKLEKDGPDTHSLLLLSDHLSDAHCIQEIEGSLEANVHYIIPERFGSRPPVLMTTEAGKVSFGYE